MYSFFSSMALIEMCFLLMPYILLILTFRHAVLIYCCFFLQERKKPVSPGRAKQGERDEEMQKEELEASPDVEAKNKDGTQAASTPPPSPALQQAEASGVLAEEAGLVDNQVEASDELEIARAKLEASKIEAIFLVYFIQYP